MKKQNKVLSLLLALVMVMTFILPMTASADPMNTDGKIIIKPPAGHSLPLESFKAYELFDLVNIVGSEYIYEPVAAVSAFLAADGMASKYGADGLTGAAAADAFRQWLQDPARTEAHVIELAKDLIENVSTLTAVNDSKKSQNDEGKIVFTGLNYGYYLVTGEGTSLDPNGAHSKNVISRGMLINVPDEYGNKDSEIALKADSPTIEKEVWHHNDTPYNGTDKPVDGNDSGWQEWTDVNVGNDVYFKLNAKVPDMTGYENYTYIVHDTLSKGITYDPAKSEMKIQLVQKDKTSVPLTKDTDYTVAAPSPSTETGESEYVGGTELKITFIDFEKWIAYEGWEVEIIYKAKLNSNAIVGKPGNPNKVNLEYSNNPNWDGEGTEVTGKTPDDDARVYTFDLEIFKYTGSLLVDDGEDGEEPGVLGTDYFALPGAEFQLRVSGTNKIIYVTKYEVGEYNYRIVSDEERADDLEIEDPENRVTTDVLITGNDGKIKIKGLDAGKYELKETKAPGGYNLLPGWITDIVIQKDDSENGYSLTVKANPENSVNVLNNTGGQLPGTGGIGVYIFFAIGGMMAILMAAAFIFYKKRKTLDTLDVE